MAVRYVLRPVNLWWRYFPQLAALYLLGWLGRKGAIELAAYVGWDNDVWASLIMPFAGLARLGSFVAMFLVLRSAIPALAALPRRSARSVDVFANIIVPFFAIYLAWKLFAEDWLDYETAALNYRVGDAMTRALETGESSGLHPDQLPVSGVTWVIIASALVLRYVLGKFKESLPGWVIAVRVYVDALWVFLTVSFAASQGASFLINPMGWIAERRIVVWLNTTRADLFSIFQPLETLWDAAMAVLRTAFGGATIPLLWLAVAGIIYGVSMPDWRGAARRVVGDRADRVFDRAAAGRKRFTERGWRIPQTVGEKVSEWAKGKVGDYQPDRRFGAADPARRRAGVDAVYLRLSRVGVAGHGGRVLPPGGRHRVPIPFHRMAFRPASSGLLEWFLRLHRSDLARDHRTAPGVLDRVDRRLLSRTGANGAD